MRLKPGADIASVKSRAGDALHGSIRTLDATDPVLSRWFTIKIAPGQEVRKAAQYAMDPDVEVAEPVDICEMAYLPTDPLFPKQWGLDQIGVGTAWDTSRGDGVKIAVIDSGIDADHPDLKAKLLPGISLMGSRYQKGRTNDGYGHGTHVAGIAAAATGNSVGIAGVAGGAKLIPIKIFADNGAPATTNDVADGIIAAVGQGASVINMSLGWSMDLAILQDTIDWAHNKGVVMVAAVGNYALEGNPVLYPAGCANVIGVGATNVSNERAYYSEHGSQVDLVAPGGQMAFDAPFYLTYNPSHPGGVYSTMPNHAFTLQGEAGCLRDYDFMQGTSMAAPFVSGVAALVMAANPGITPDRLELLLEQTALDLGASGWDEYFGHGLVQADQAVERARPGKKVMIETSKGFALEQFSSPNAADRDLADDLVAAGYSLTTDSGDLSNISSADILVVSAHARNGWLGELANPPYSPEEAAVIGDFVRGGGKLVLLGENGDWGPGRYPAAVSEVASSVAVQFDPVGLAAEGALDSANFASYPVFEGVRKLSFFYSGTIASCGQPLLWTDQGQTLAALSQVGAGYAMVFTDWNWIGDYGQRGYGYEYGDNAEFALKCFDWLAAR